MKNEYNLITKDVAEIELTQGQTCLVDADDLELIAPYKWHASYDDYRKGFIAATSEYVPTREPRQKTLLMSRLLMGATDPVIYVDHINMNSLDNRRCNLRFASHLENLWNRRPQRNSKTGIKNISWHKGRQKYQLKISVNNKEHFFYLDTLEDAIAKKAEMLPKLHGDFHRLARLRLRG